MIELRQAIADILSDELDESLYMDLRPVEYLQIYLSNYVSDEFRELAWKPLSSQFHRIFKDSADLENIIDTDLRAFDDAA